MLWLCDAVGCTWNYATTQEAGRLITLSGAEKPPMVALLQTACQFRPHRGLESMLSSSALEILWVITSAIILLRVVTHTHVSLGAIFSAFMCVAYDLGSALQTGLCAWLTMCWQVKPLLHQGFSVCSFCFVTTFQPLKATVWRGFGWARHLI